MSEEKNKELGWKKHWLTGVGLGATILFPLTLYWIEIGTFAFPNGTILQDMAKKFRGMSANETGDFLAGLFAPLAFMWLVIGYYQNNRAIKLQSDELKNSIDEMRKANETASDQKELLAATERHARREIFFKYFDYTSKELDDLVLGILEHYPFRREGLTNKERVPVLKVAEHILSVVNNKNIGDKEFSSLQDYKLSHHTKMVFAYIETFQNLLIRAEEFDTNSEGELKRFVQSTSYQQCYEALKAHQERFLSQE